MSRVRTIVTTEVLMLGGLLVFVGLAFALERLLFPDGPIPARPLTVIPVACIPAALWLGYFYSQDRLEPEPKGYVIGSYLLGCFLAGPVAEFFIEVARADGGRDLDALAAPRWIAAIAIVGIAQETCKYAVVRYSLYLSPEFDEPVDGVVYASAAGIGFATYESSTYLLASGDGMYLSIAATTAVLSTLAHASFAGVMGFALGVAKFPARPGAHRGTVLAVGLLVAAILNGTFQMVTDALRVRSLSDTPIARIAFGFGFATATLLVVSFLMRRLVDVSPHASEETS